jgi:hypothetical protein
MRSFIYGTFLAFVLLVCIGFGDVPKPAIIQKPNEWTVETRFTQPQQILIEGYREGKARRFWYMILTVTNKSDRDVDFYPQCELMTDTFELIPSGKNMPVGIFEQIKKRHKSSYPFLELLEQASNKILQGEDNAKDLAIIWPDFDAKAKSIKIFIGGLSNETAIISHPIERDENGRPKRVFLRKTLELNYDIGGDPAFRSEARLEFKDKRWIMR